MRRLAAGALVAGLALGGAGCGGLTAVSRHFRARVDTDYCAGTVPTALAAVGGHGKLVLVRPERGDQLAGVLATPHPPQACLVVVHGSYTTGQIAAAPHQSGSYALLVVRVKTPSVIWARVQRSRPRAGQPL